MGAGLGFPELPTGWSHDSCVAGRSEELRSDSALFLRQKLLEASSLTTKAEVLTWTTAFYSLTLASTAQLPGNSHTGALQLCKSYRHTLLWSCPPSSAHQLTQSLPLIPMPMSIPSEAFPEHPSETCAARRSFSVYLPPSPRPTALGGTMSFVVCPLAPGMQRFLWFFL